jgi:23S rRNA (cytosine1962-C5)-methyltransferase
MLSLTLNKGRERSVIRKHPWIFASAVAALEGNPGAGETIQIHSYQKDWLACGSYSPSSQIRARIWTWDLSEIVNEEFFRIKIDKAIRSRLSFFGSERCNAYREVYAESDGLPGLIIDRYDDYRVIQFLTCGAEYWREAILQALIQRGDCLGVYERSDVDVRQLEGLQPRQGHLWGNIPEEKIVIMEHGFRYYVDIIHGHKTGFYLDQRQNRRVFGEMLPADAEVLDCFCYTGAFTIAALSKGARQVLAIDSSTQASEWIHKNLELNGLTAERLTYLQEDVFSALRRLRDQSRSFDVVVLDPPKFASTPAHIQRASRGYKDINLLAMKLLRPGGLLFTFSCSGGVGVELFQKIVADAALDAGRIVRAICWLGQAEDHPVALNFPEGRYLKGLVCQVE